MSASVIHVLPALDCESLKAAAARPGAAWIEEPVDAAIPHARAIAEAGGLAIDVTARSAYGAPLAPLFCGWLKALGALDDTPPSADIELTIHEALSNAILHGDLGLQDDWRTGVAAFRARSAAVQAALADPERANRRVTLGATWDQSAITVVIADQGEGYKDTALADADARPNRGLGLCMRFADDVSIEEGGRMLRLRFAT